MADRIEENADLAVSELRRKARRRLVGAVVLALAAAILLPLLLETDPRPLGDDVSIQIPPVDNGRFVSRLSPEKAKDAKSDSNAAAKPGDAPPPVGPAAATPAAATPAAATPAATKPAAATPAATKPAAAKSAAATPASDVPVTSTAGSAPSAAAPPPAAAKASPPELVTPALAPATTAVVDGATGESAPKATSATAEPATPVAAPAAPAAEPAAADSRKPEGFIIQLAAFTDDKGANSLANKVKKEGYPAYTEPVHTANRGTLWRVRVGGFPTRAEANEALAKLKAAGHHGLVSAAK